MRSRRPGQRRGFTLLELIIVIGIITLLATLSVLFLPNLDRNKGVPNAVTQVEGWIRLQKNQALRDGAPRGVRLIPDANNPNRCVQVQFIEQPEPIAPHGMTPPQPGFPNGLRIALQIVTPNPNQPNPPPYPNPSPAIVTLVLLDPQTGNPVAANNWDDPLNPQIMPGDFLELTASPHLVAQIMTPPSPPLPPLTGAVRSTFLLDRPVDGTDVSPLILTEGFRVIRSPRPLAGEPIAELHKDVYIDLSNCYPCPPPATPDPNNAFTGSRPWTPTGTTIDLLFNSSGLVANAPTGQIIIPVRHVDRQNDITLIVVYTRTGKVTAVPIWDAGGDPYLFARDGRNPGL